MFVSTLERGAVERLCQGNAVHIYRQGAYYSINDMVVSKPRILKLAREAGLVVKEEFIPRDPYYDDARADYDLFILTAQKVDISVDSRISEN